MEWLLHVLGAALGAGFGASAANFFALRRDKKQEAMKLFVAIHQSLHTFPFVLMRMIAADSRHAHLAGNQQLNAVNAPPFRVKQEDVQAASEKKQEAERACRSATATLRGHAVAVRLLFARKGAELAKSLTAMCGVAEQPPSFNLETLEKEVLPPMITAIETEIELLWRPIESWDGTE